MHLSSQSIGLQGYALGSLTTHPTLAASATGGAAEPNEGPWFVLQFAWERCAAFGWYRIGSYFLLAMILSLLLLWPFARKIAGPNRILTETTLFVGSVIALSAAFLALAGFMAQSGSIALLAGLGVIYAAILFAQTRHIFEASRAAAAGILGCFVVLAGGAFYGAEYLMGPTPWTEFFSKTREEQSRQFSEWRNGKKTSPSTASAIAAADPGTMATPGPTSAPGTPNPAGAPAMTAVPPTVAAPVATTPPAPSSGELDLHAIYLQLQKARAELDLNDPVAVERFNVQAEAYKQEKLIAAMAAARRQQAAKTAPTASANQTAPAPKAIR